MGTDKERLVHAMVDSFELRGGLHLSTMGTTRTTHPSRRPWARSALQEQRGIVPVLGVAYVVPAQGLPESVLAFRRPGEHSPAGMLPAQQFNGLRAEALAAVPVGDFHEVNLQTFRRLRDPVTGINPRAVDDYQADDFLPCPGEAVEQV